MTEAEWLASDDPAKMLAFLRDRATPRKLRLLACACCRRLWNVITNRTSRKAIEIAERFADKQVGDHERATARVKTIRGLTVGERYHGNPAYFAVGRTRDQGTEVLACLSAAQEIAGAAAARSTGHEGTAALSEAAAQCRRIRDIFRPHHPCPRVSVTPDALRLAQAAYEERAVPQGHLDPGRLRVLSDAIEEAGCGDESILSHLRSPGPHVRGCWAVDLILDKK